MPATPNSLLPGADQAFEQITAELMAAQSTEANGDELLTPFGVHIATALSELPLRQEAQLDSLLSPCTGDHQEDRV